MHNMLSIRTAVPVRTANSVHTSQRAIRRCGHRNVQAGFRSRRDWQVCAIGNHDKQPSQETQDHKAVLGIGVALAAVLVFALTAGRESLEDAVYGDGLDLGISSFTAGDLTGSLLWSFSLWFCSPLQLLLLFLGAIETERPSDWLLNKLGQAAGLRVDDVDYSAPQALRVAVAVICLGAGTAIAVLLGKGLQDATWSVSTGLGACFAAGIYEVGRPQRFSPAEVQKLEAQWQDFASFGRGRLRRSGRCHESEIITAFRKSSAKYRTEEQLEDRFIRDMMRNFAPGSSITSQGYVKGLSLVERTDPFTGAQSGSAKVDASGFTE